MALEIRANGWAGGSSEYGPRRLGQVWLHTGIVAPEYSLVLGGVHIGCANGTTLSVSDVFIFPCNIMSSFVSSCTSYVTEYEVGISESSWKAGTKHGSSGELPVSGSPRHYPSRNPAPSRHADHKKLLNGFPHEPRPVSCPCNHDPADLRSLPYGQIAI